MLDLDYKRATTDTAAGETQTREFKRLNPRGQIPVLADEGAVIRDSMAILVYLARRYGDESWLPNDALGEARVMQWLAVSENELLYGLARARVALLKILANRLVGCLANASHRHIFARESKGPGTGRFLPRAR